MQKEQPRDALKQIGYTHDCTDHRPDGLEFCWPETNTTTSIVTGELAERCRKMLGVDDPSVRVTITEREVVGGWSEYTTETDYWCELDCGSKSWRPESDYGKNGLEQLLEALDKAEGKK